jgi:hypothetical protein
VISTEKAKKILRKNGNKFTDEEIEKIIRFLLQLAEINVEHYFKHKDHEESSFDGKSFK